MAGKRALGTLVPIGTTKPKAEVAAPPENKLLRGSVQTVRMDNETLKKLKYASIERGISQNEIMLFALRRDLGLE